MAAERREFKISGSGWSITAPEEFGADGIVLTELNGWDEVPNVSIETVPKLFGSGSFIRSKRLTERNLELSLFVGEEQAESVRFDVIEQVKTAAESFQSVTLTRTWLYATKPDRRERLTGLITGVNGVQAYEDGSMSFSMTVVCHEPTKTITYI